MRCKNACETCDSIYGKESPTVAKTKITIPPPQPSAIEVGDLDLSAIREHGRRVRGMGPYALYGFAINVDGGSIIYVPNIPVAELGF